MRHVAVVVLGLVAAACASSAGTPAPSATTRPSPGPSSTSPTSATTRPVPTPTPIPTATASVEPAPIATPAGSPTAEPADFVLTSTAFAEGEAIPPRYTCDGADDQLPLAWSGVPAGTAELALIQHDPDAGGWVHWVVVGIPPAATGIDGPLPDGARHGTNDFDRIGYDGPCPPSGNHTYVTTLVALSDPLDLGEAPTARQVRQAAESVTIARAQLRGTYSRN